MHTPIILLTYSFMQDHRLPSILFRTLNGASLSPSHLWMITKNFHFHLLEIAKRDGDHPCLMIGHYNRKSRPRESTVSSQFADFQESNPGFFLKTNQATDAFFIAVPYDNTGSIDDAKDETTLCRQFNTIKTSTEPDIDGCSYHYINQVKYDSLHRQDQATWSADKEESSGKRRREDDSTLILGEASGAASTSAEERLKTQLAEQERELRGAVEREKELRTEIEQLTAKNDELTAEHTTENAKLTAKNDELTAELTTKNDELITANEELEQLRVNHAAPPPLAVDQGEIERLREENESLKTKVEKKNEKIKELKHNKKSPSNLVETLNSQNVELIAAAAAKDTEIVKLTAATAAKNNKIAQITAATAAKDTTIADLRRKLAEAPAVGNGKEKDDEIEDLIKQNIEYQEITKESLDREQKRINERPVRNNEVQRLELKIVEHQIKFMSYLCGDKRAKEDIARTQLRVIVTDIHNRQEECYRGMRELCAAAGHRFPHF